MAGVLFRLPEHDIAAKTVAHPAIDELSLVHAPSLRLFLRRPVPHVPVARVNIDDQPPLRIAPVPRADGGRFDIRAVVVGRFDDLVANLGTAARNTAKTKVRYMQSVLDRVTEATGQRRPRRPSWETLMAMLENAPVGFDDDGNPTFKIIAGPAAADKFNNLPEQTAKQRAAWDALMERKRDEFRARERHRRLS